MSGLQFDNKISLGHVISIALIIFGGVTAYADLRSSQTQLSVEITNIGRKSERLHPEFLAYGFVSSCQTVSEVRGMTKVQLEVETL